MTHKLTVKIHIDRFQMCSDLLACISLKCSKNSYFHIEAVFGEVKRLYFKIRLNKQQMRKMDFFKAIIPAINYCFRRPFVLTRDNKIICWGITATNSKVCFRLLVSCCLSGKVFSIFTRLGLGN